MSSPIRARSSRLWRDRAVWARVRAFARPHRKAFAVVAGLTVVTNMILLSYPLIYGRLIDDVADHEVPAFVVPVIVGVLLLTATHLVLRIVAVRRANTLYGTIGADLQSALFDRIQRQPIGFFTVSNTGAIASRTVDEAVAAVGVYRDALAFALNNVATVVLSVGALLFLDWRSLGAVALVALALVPARRFEHRFRAASAEEFFTAADLRSRSVERLNGDGNLVVKTYGDYEDEAARFREESRRVWDVKRRLDVSRTTVQGVVMLAVNAVALLLLVAATTASGDTVSIGTIVAVLVYLRLLEGPLAGMADARLNISRDLIAFARVLEVLDGLPAPPAIVPERSTRPTGRLVFDGVAYTYPTRGEMALVPSLSLSPDATPQNPASLLDVSFTVEPGELVALVGRSGTGKTTIAMLAAGLLEPTAGSVTIDGEPAARLRGSAGQQGVAFVAQDTFLFHDSLRANILFARPDATERELHAACVAAGVHDFAWDLPMRYHTVVGEKGQRLSGGERQRIALARAILRDPALIVFDEPTAHLDTLTEASVQAALDQIFADRARLVIAHRLSTVRAADRILVLHDGRIAESGSHDELVARHGRYSTLYGIELVDAAAPARREAGSRA